MIFLFHKEEKYLKYIQHELHHIRVKGSVQVRRDLYLSVAYTHDYAQKKKE